MLAVPPTSGPSTEDEDVDRGGLSPRSRSKNAERTSGLVRSWISRAVAPLDRRLLVVALGLYSSPCSPAVAPHRLCLLQQQWQRSTHDFRC